MLPKAIPRGYPWTVSCLYGASSSARYRTLVRCYSNKLPGFATGTRPKCRYARSVACLPRGVRCK